MNKRVVSIVLVFCLILAVFPVSAFAAGDVVASGTCGVNLTWVLSERGTLTISGTGDMMNYFVASSVPWYNYCESIYSVDIKYGVTTIGYGAFYGCSNLTNVSISDSVSTIEYSAFEGCNSLTNISIPDSVTSIGGYAFRYCNSLTSVAIPEGVTTIGDSAFAFCSSLTNVNIPDGVASIDGVFQGCSSLISITIPDRVSSIGFATFAGCSSLASITIPYNVASIGDYAFSGCSSLTSVTIPGRVTSIGNYAFNYCTSMTSVSIPNGVTSIEDYAFNGCSDLTSVTIPASVKSIGDFAFYGCSSLASLNILDGVTSIGQLAFAYCGRLTSVTIPYTVVSIGRYAFCDSDNLTCVFFKGNPPLIAENSFENVSATAYFPANNKAWTADKLQNYGGTITWMPSDSTMIASGSCGKKLTWTLDKNGLLTISGTGAMYDDLWENDVQNGWNGHAGDVISLVIEDGVTSIGAWAFFNCSNLTSASLPDSIMSIGFEAFGGCSSLSDICIPHRVTSIDAWAFGSCDSLIEIAVPNSVTSIGPWAFAYCSNLERISISSNLTSISAGMFASCSSLTDIVIPEGISVIELGAFYECTRLDSISIPRSVTSIQNEAFSGCENLNKTIFLGNAPELGDNLFAGVTADVYYPANNKTWTDAVNQDYGGKITWVPVSDEPEVPEKPKNDFSDVRKNDYFYDAVIWAVENGITDGTSDTTFSPETTCTRAQVVTFLWRAAGKPEPKTTKNPFSDVTPDQYYYKAVLWAVENCITNGTSDTAFSPNDPCVRAQVVPFMWRAEGEPDVTADNPFTDVNAEEYYAKAVQWVVKNEITNGTSDTTFSPLDDCKRGQVVTFLYRATTAD